MQTYSHVRDFGWPSEVDIRYLYQSDVVYLFSDDAFNCLGIGKSNELRRRRKRFEERLSKRGFLSPFRNANLMSLETFLHLVFYLEIGSGEGHVSLLRRHFVTMFSRTVGRANHPVSVYKCLVMFVSRRLGALYMC